MYSLPYKKYASIERIENFAVAALVFLFLLNEPKTKKGIHRFNDAPLSISAIFEINLL